ncbi:MAG: CPBP family intramembrane metalloprotease [Anaerolineales bacterium]
MISKINLNDNFLRSLALLVTVYLASFYGTTLILNILDIAGRAYSNLIINGVFLLISIGSIHLFGLNAEDVGLKILPQRLALHVKLSLALFTMYWLYYLLVVRISGLRPFTSAMVWGLLNYLLVAISEEIYFRGLWYHIVEKRFSGRAALLISGLVFGLSHYRQGLGMLPKLFTGCLWGSVRCATGMIFLLIPVHFTYNAVWFLFQGDWDNQTIIVYLFPLFELLIAILIVVCFKRAKKLTDIEKVSTSLDSLNQIFKEL